MWQKLKDIAELVMLKHTVFALPFILVAMMSASYQKTGSGCFSPRLLLLAVLAAFFARNFAMGVNRYLDRDIDKLNPRTRHRPSVDGRVSEKEMRLFIVLNALLFLAICYLINPLAFALAFPILVVLGAYTLFKRFSSMAHLVLGLALGLSPIAGEVAVAAQISLWSLLLGAGVMFWVAGFDLLYALQDIDFDKKHALHSIPAVLGAEKAMLLARLFHPVALLFWYLYMQSLHLGIFAKVGLALVAMMLFYEHYLVKKDFSKIDKAFFTVNTYVGVVFFLSVVVEICL